MFKGIKGRNYTRANKIAKKKNTGKNKQYGIQHSVTKTIHSSQG